MPRAIAWYRRRPRCRITITATGWRGGFGGLLLLLFVGVMTLTGTASATPSRAPTQAAAVRIVIGSPQAAIYGAGRVLAFRFSCLRAVDVARCTATLNRPGARPRTLTSGTRLRLTRTGSYVFRVTATNRRRRSTTKLVRFLTERTVSWSGYTWYVRPPGRGAPQHNFWSDSSANVRVSGGDLLLSVVRDRSGRWTSAEIDNQLHLGYGTYRWVVASDLTAMDPYQVLGMFTYDPRDAGRDEIDLEPSRWGNPLWPSGSAAVWQDAVGEVRQSQTFDYSPNPPYVNQFTWLPGRVTYLVTDATGATLLDWTVTSGVPKPGSDIPIINYWRFHAVAPAATTTVRVSSFSWQPPR